MKIVFCPLAALLALAMAPGAAARQQDTHKLAPLPPPPGIDAPGVKAVAPPTSKKPVHETPASTASTSQPGDLPPEATRDLKGNLPPRVSVHHRDGSTIEEYRQGGQLVMVRITPKHGVPYTYIVDDNGKLRGPPGAPPVKPVFYTIFEWGKPPPPADNSKP